MKRGENIRILWTGDYPILEASLLNEIKLIRKCELLNYLLILISSKLLGLHLRRFLAERGIPHLNLRFRTLEEIAREVISAEMDVKELLELFKKGH